MAKEVRELIRRMSFENPLWGATKIHGELLKLGIEVAQSTVSIFKVPRRWPALADLEELPSQSNGGNCRDRPLCGSDDCVSPTVRIACSWPQEATAVVVCGDPANPSRAAQRPTSAALGASPFLPHIIVTKYRRNADAILHDVAAILLAHALCPSSKGVTALRLSWRHPCQPLVLHVRAHRT